jgi:hypothetical protein
MTTRAGLAPLWSWNGTIERLPYLLIGTILFLFKFAIDWMIATYGFDRPWSPLNYVVWPNDRVVRILELDGPERRFSLTMLVVSLPFIWVGVSLTLQRLRATGLPLGLILLFFVPLVNLLLFAMLVLLPSRESGESAAVAHEPPHRAGSMNNEETPPETGIREVPQGTRRMIGASEEIPHEAGIREVPKGARPTIGLSESGFTAMPPKRIRRDFEPLRKLHRSIVLESHWRSGLLALALAVPLTVLGVFLGAHVLQSYGFSLFLGAPFALGMISVLLFGLSRPQPFGACMGVAMAATFLAGVAILIVALEGAVCLIMAAPIAFFLAFLGAVVGYVIQSRPWLSDHAMSLALAVLLVLPALMAAETASEPEPEVRAVSTEVLIEAPPAAVWQRVIAFPPLAEPDDWLFQAGIAYPQRAEIHGSGVGAIRLCIFSTGTFVEPIEIWEAPQLLRFAVTEQPEPMREWSPYHIHPAHLDHYLRSHKGQFLLESLPQGRTRLVGTTWYTNKMWPACYWSLWSDSIIHRIHARVLAHIKELAETNH